MLVAALVALYTIVGFFVVPPLVKGKLEATLSAALGRQTTIERIAFNPFTLKATIDGVVVRNRGAGTPLLAIAGLEAEISAASLRRLAPIVDALRVNAPQLHLVRNADGSYNIQDLIDAWLAAPPGPPPAFSLNNIEVVDGVISLDDQPLRRQHRIEGLTIGVPFLSSLPYDTEVKVAPVLAARINGAPLALTGETTPFAQGRQVSLDINLEALSVPAYLDYVPLPLKVRVASGELTTHLKLTFIDGDAATRALRLSGDVSVTKLAVQGQDGVPLLATPALRIALGTLDAFARVVEVSRVVIERPEIDVRRRADGTFEAGDLIPVGVAPSPNAKGAPTERPWRVRVAEARIEGATARLQDASTSPVFNATLSDMAVTASNLGSEPTDKGRVALSLRTDLGATIEAQSDVTLMPLGIQGTFAIAGLDLRRLFPYYASALNLEVGDGKLDLAASLTVTAGADGAAAITLADGDAKAHDLRLLFPGERDPLWRVPLLTATGVAVDVDRHTVALAQVAGRQVIARVRRDADGGFSWARLLRTGRTTGGGATSVAVASSLAPAAAPAASPSASPTAAPPASPAAAPSVTPGSAPVAEPTWQLAIGKMDLQRCTIDVEDLVPARPVTLRFTDLDVRAENYSNGRDKRGTLELRTRVGSAGRLAVNGPFGTNPVAASFRIDAQGIALPPLQPYLDPRVNATVTAGAAVAKGTLAFAIADAGDVSASFAGDLGITDFASIDKLTASDLVKWKTLALGGVDATLTPWKLGIGAAALDDFFARVIVHADGTLNLTQLLLPEGAPPGAEAEPAPGAAGARPPSAVAGARKMVALPVEGGGLPVVIGRIELSKGNVQYSDFFIKPNYSANLTDVAGRVSAMSAQQAGEVEIAANVEHTAPVEIRGRINPFAPELDLDLTGKARDIELPPLSPYAAKYAGYRIEKGKLSFDAHYKVGQRKLAAENKLVLDQLTFGERVDSPTATKLPVLLAVALLKDRQGIIDIQLPIAGSLDDPEFSVGGLIVRVIVNLLTKAVTAPFALLGAVFGSGGEQYAFVEFAPGRAEITPVAAGRISTLAKALADRPQLKLDIVGRADPATDTDGLRAASLERLVKAQQRKALVAAGGESAAADATAVEAADYPRYLEAAYKEAKFDKPRTAIGLERSLPPAEMEALLLRNATVGDEALRQLANARAQVVKDAIEQSGGIADARLFLLAPRQGAEGIKDGGKPNRVDFALK